MGDEAELGPADFAVDIEAEPEPVEITEAKRKIKFNLGLPDLPSFKFPKFKRKKPKADFEEEIEGDSVEVEDSRGFKFKLPKFNFNLPKFNFKSRGKDKEDDSHLFDYFKRKDLPKVDSETQTDEVELGPADFNVDIEAEPEPEQITEAKRKIKFNLGLPDLPSFKFNWKKKDRDTSRDSEEIEKVSKTGSLKFGFRSKGKKPKVEFGEEVE